MYKSFIYLSVFLVYFIQASIGQTLHSNELSSIRWIIQTYNLNWDLSANKCSAISSKDLQCIVVGTTEYIKSINIRNPPYLYQNNAQSITALTFTKLESFNIVMTSSPNSDGTFILNYLNNPLNIALYNISINVNQNINMSSNFPLNINLKELYLDSVQILSYIPDNLLKNKMEILSLGENIYWAKGLSSFGSIYTIKKIKWPWMFQTYSYLDSNFPQLKSLMIFYLDGIEVNITLSNIEEINLKDGSLILSSAPKLKTLQLYNMNISVKNFDFTIFPLLKEIYFQVVNISPVTNFPKLDTFFWTNSDLQTFPKENWLNPQASVVLRENKLSGSIPIYNNQFNHFYVDGNINIGGSIPEFSCQSFPFDFSGTSLTQVPDCILCHYSLLTDVLPKITIPNNFKCLLVPEVYQTHFVITSNTTEIIINGKNLGFGIDIGTSNLSPKISNSQFSYKPISTKGSALLQFSISSNIQQYISWESYVNPYISSISTVTEKGGDIEIGGVFGVYVQKIRIQINDQNCTVKSFNDTLLICNIGILQVGKAKLYLQNMDDGKQFLNNNILFIYPSQNESKCIDPSNNSICNNNGSCTMETCKCNVGITGKYCNERAKSDESSVPVDKSKPTPTFRIDDYDFKFNLIEIQELDSMKNVIASLGTNEWSLEIDENNANISKLTYTLLNTIGFKVTAIIENSKIEREVHFAGLTNYLPANSLKLSVKIQGWNYQSNVNTLRVVFSSDAGVNTSAITNECDLKTEIGIDRVDNSVQFLKMIRGGQVYYGRFFPVVLSNGRPTYSLNEVVNRTKDTIYYGLNLPQCGECLIDPDFSMLIESGHGTTRCGKEKSKTWLVATVVSVVGFAVISITVATVVYLRIKWIAAKEKKERDARLKAFM